MRKFLSKFNLVICFKNDENMAINKTHKPGNYFLLFQKESIFYFYLLYN